MAAEPAQTPLIAIDGVDPNIMLNVSVEFPVAAAAYNDFYQAGICGGKETIKGIEFGVCYDKDRTYLGYFDSKKCYLYSTRNGGYFYPVALTNAAHQCKQQFSGNFMNWATLEAIDSFSYVLTGGDRVVDESNSSSAATVVERAHQHDRAGYLEVEKFISSKKSKYKISENKRFVTNLSTVTPWSAKEVYINNPIKQKTVRFGTKHGLNDLGGMDYTVRVKVCDPAVIPGNVSDSLERNCVSYSDGQSTWYKPEGLIQKFQDRARFGVISFGLDSALTGGIVRSNVKYLGGNALSVSRGVSANANREINTDGTFAHDPDQMVGRNGIFDVTESGVINFVNKFDTNGYRGRDPVSYPTYEAIRYFKKKGSTPEYYPSSKPGISSGFPFIPGSQWKDPVQAACQKNMLVSIGDSYQWGGTRLPGTHYSSRKYKNLTLDEASYGEPSNADSDINVRLLTNDLGVMEGLTGGRVMRMYCAPAFANCDYADAVMGNLGEMMLSRRRETHYMAGLSYYANTKDLRADYPGMQNLKHFVVDIVENGNDYDSHRLWSPMWMSGKYGFFDDKNGDGKPQPGEWDANQDGRPDGYVDVDQPSKLMLGLYDALSHVTQTTEMAFSTVGLAIDSGTLGKEIVYQSTFKSGAWWGDLKAIEISESDLTNTTDLWSARDKLESMDVATRKLFVIDPNAVAGGRGVAFQWNSLTAEQKGYLNQINDIDDGLGDKRLAYLRGERSEELQQGGGFRNRDYVLGDIVNSDTVVLDHSNYGYDALPGSDGDSYSNYRTSDAYRKRPSVIMVGANDGFLHAFHARSGKELFGVMPKSSLTKISELTYYSYTHRYFVDGQISVSDAHLKGAWTTVALVSAGAGGRSVFALDVSDPENFAGEDVLWEFDPKTDQDMGFELGKPTIARLAGGQWVAIFANGAHSVRGRAVLYIVNLENGSVLKKIDFGRGPGATPNGLFTPSVVDQNLDGVADYVYVGDAKGYLWKVDLTGKTADTWKSSYGTSAAPLPLFQACSDVLCSVRQPITHKPRVGLHPTKGVIVYFGTGQYFDWYDRVQGSFNGANSFYAIWDRGETVSGRTQLLKQQFLAAGSRTAGVSFRVSSDNDIQWFDGTSGKKGWYIDLIDPSSNSPAGERIFTQPRLSDGKVSFLSVRPNNDPCQPGGQTFSSHLDAFNGGRLDSAFIDTNLDGAVKEDDLVLYAGRLVAPSTVMISGMSRGASVLQIGDNEVSIFNLSNASLEKVTTVRAREPVQILWRQLR